MVNIIGREHKLSKQNRHQPVVTIRILNTLLLTSNSHDKSNEKIYVGSKELIYAETYPRPINVENYAFWLFLACFIHFLGENNGIIDPLIPMHAWILLPDVFVGGFCTA